MLNKIWKTEKKFSERDVILFSNLTGDDNRIHLDEEYAKKSIFGEKVVHGMLVASLFSKIFGKVFPGEGSIYLKQEIKSTFDPLKESVEELSENIKKTSTGSRFFFWKK